MGKNPRLNSRLILHQIRRCVSARCDRTRSAYPCSPRDYRTSLAISAAPSSIIPHSVMPYHHTSSQDANVLPQQVLWPPGKQMGYSGSSATGVLILSGLLPGQPEQRSIPNQEASPVLHDNGEGKILLQRSCGFTDGKSPVCTFPSLYGAGAAFLRQADCVNSSESGTYFTDSTGD